MNLKTAKFKYLKFNVLLILILSCYNLKSQPVTISGKITNPNGSKISIRTFSYAKEIKLSKEGEFSDTLHIKSGEYSLTDFKESTSIYLEPGYDLYLTLNTNEFDESLTYKGIGEKPNNFLAQYLLYNEKHTLSNQEYTSISEEGFYKLETNKHKELIEMLEKAVEDNIAFVSLQKDKFYYTMLSNVLRKSGNSFFNSNSTNSISNFLESSIKNIHFEDTLLYQSNRYYKSFFNNYFTMGLVADNQNCVDLFLNELNNNQKTNIIQLIGRGISFYNLDDITSYYDALLKLEGDINELAKYNSLYERISSLSEGSPSPNFNYKNIQGKKVSLTSLKGKLVYIDVWATWCGPCKAQIPYLKQLEELYRNKAIEFVSISIDQPKDEEKWRKMVVGKQLKGIQLIADDAWKSSFVKDYVIQGIPRFILLDKKGNIISPSAPRPGQYGENGDMSLNSEIKDLINQYLD
tara:strand:+ start:2811 stop:4199 length:1389 start_codon:yes stop_codon:yes gene_type:complete